MPVHFNPIRQMPPKLNTKTDLTKYPRIMNAFQARVAAQYFALGQSVQSMKKIIDCLAIRDLVTRKVEWKPIPKPAKKVSKLSDDEQLIPVCIIAVALAISGLNLAHFIYKHYSPAPKQTELPKQEPLD